ncbi:hypothetical protein Leryth_024819 [Lithospermum erythrorhizon]|nr:hypothetical protein Leryth_024819 [Lithospermum erythrorhizon]
MIPQHSGMSIHVSKGRRRAHVCILEINYDTVEALMMVSRVLSLKYLTRLRVHGLLLVVRTLRYPSNYLVSAAIKETNTILIGSNDSFYSLEVEDVGNGSVEGRWKRELHKCPSDLIDVCFFEPGLTNKHYVLWYTRGCIYGLDLISYKYFTVDLADLAYNVDWLHPKLVDLGAGILSLIYTGSECLTSIDDHGVEHDLIDHHCITFEINYDRLDKIESNMPFPGIELQKTVVSRYKCYAPGVEYIYQLGSAFAM